MEFCVEYIVLSGKDLTFDQFIKAVRNGYHVMLSAEAEIKVIKARETTEKALNNKRVIYGLTTGFGALSDVVISKDQTKQLQRNILMSHAAGVGNNLDEEITRATLLLKINNLANGHSGINLETLKTLVEIYNKGIYPLMPEKGSVGASGDLAPLAHMFLILVGQGEAIYKSKILSGKAAMDEGGLKLIV